PCGKARLEGSVTDYIYTMQGLSKVHLPSKKVVENVYLSFLPGAKIGVIGVNGAGKSSLLRIMAGQDTDFTGEALLRPRATVGYLSQEPDLGDATTVREVVDGAVSQVREVLARFEAVSMRFGESLSEDEMNKLLEEQSALQDRIDACDGWNVDHTVE